MPRYDWRDREDDRRGRGHDPADREDFGLADYSRDWRYDPETRTGYRAEDRAGRDDDYGQADYSRDWSYDEDRGPYRRGADARYGADRRYEDTARDREPRSWMDRAGNFLAGRDRGGDPRRDDPRRDDRRYAEERRRSRRHGPSDRVLWAVIVERLEDERGLDLRDVEVLVDEAEVTLNGTVRRKEDKRRIEDVADVDGVRNVQNNLRVRDRSHWSFL